MLLELFCDPRSYSTSALAFIGDAVYTLLSREDILCRGNCPAGQLHNMSVSQVRCEAQAAALDRILPHLTEREADICKRGRNTHTAHTPKNSTTADYHSATALETLFGWLYVNGENDRMKELYNIGNGEARENEEN